MTGNLSKLDFANGEQKQARKAGNMILKDISHWMEKGFFFLFFITAPYKPNPNFTVRQRRNGSFGGEQRSRQRHRHTGNARDLTQPHVRTTRWSSQTHALPPQGWGGLGQQLHPQEFHRLITSTEQARQRGYTLPAPPNFQNGADGTRAEETGDEVTHTKGNMALTSLSRRQARGSLSPWVGELPSGPLREA